MAMASISLQLGYYQVIRYNLGKINLTILFSNLLNSETVSRKKSDWETRHHHLLLGMDNILEYDTRSVLSSL